MDDIITARDLTIGYDGTAVIRDLSFDIPSGRITAVIGKSGSGKSTLLKTLAGLIPPLRGEIVFEGRPLDFGSEAGLRTLYDRIGVLYQGGALLNNLTLHDNIALPVRMRHPDMPAAVLRELVDSRLARVGLSESAAKRPAELSGGMRKRAALARAIVLEPAVIFCDEPSAGLDPATAADLDELLVTLKETFGATLVIVTHEIRTVNRAADRALVLGGGRLRFAGEAAALRASDDAFIRSFFLEDKQP